MPDRFHKLNAEPPELHKAVLRYFIDNHGLKICAYYWPAEHAQAVVVLNHGHNGYTGFEWLQSTGLNKPRTYEGSWVQKLNAAGFSVAAIDLPGFGRSEGKRGLHSYFDSFDELVDANILLVRGLQHLDIKGFKGLPVFMGGVSLGGCVATMTTFKDPSLFRGAVLMCPMLSLEKLSRKGLNPYLRPISRILSWLVPTMPLAATEKNEKFPEVQRDFDADDGCYHGATRIRVATEYLRITERAVRVMSQMSFPFIVFHCRTDTYVDPEGTEMLVARSKASDKTVVWVDDMWHVLNKEPGNEKVLQRAIAWMTARIDTPIPNGVVQ